VGPVGGPTIRAVSAAASDPVPPSPVAFTEPTPFAVHAIETGDGHRLHVEEHGAPDGRPLLLLHGGPGSGCSPVLRRSFDLRRWRLICPDQRGAGRSQPAGETRANSTAHLLADLRRLRRALGIDRWCVIGGSWGATLALLHALDEPQAVDALLLRAVFLARDADVAAFFDGADELAQTCGALPGEPLAAALGRCFANNGDDAAQRATVQAWWAWEQRQQRGAEDPPLPAAFLAAGPADPAAARRRFQIQAQYLVAGCGLRERPLLERIRQAPSGWPADLPVTLLHGRADRVCPPTGAEALQAALPRLDLRWIDGAGHDPTHPAMAAAMRAACAELFERPHRGDGSPA